METIWTTGPQGKWKKCIYLSSYKMQIEKGQCNENLQITTSLNPSCSKISARKFPKYWIALYPETTGKLWAALLYNLGTRSYCIWSWELSIFYLFVFKPTPSVFTSSRLAFNTFIEKQFTERGPFFSFSFCYNFEQKGYSRREVLCFKFSWKIYLSFDLHWSLKDLVKSQESSAEIQLSTSMLDVGTTFIFNWQKQHFSDLILLTKCRLPLQEEMNWSLEMFYFLTTKGVQRAEFQQTNPTSSMLGITLHNHIWFLC